MARAEKIFDRVASEGDPVLFDYTRQLEGHKLSTSTVRVSEAEIKRAASIVPARDVAVMKRAARRIRAFHKKQKIKGFRFSDGRGTVIEERVVPLDRVGLCIPGGRAPLCSTVLMTSIPARLAGVRELVMISPWPKGVMNPHVLAAAEVAGVDSVFKIGGAQGVAALASGTASVPRVDKIVGPGSVWVTAAKAIAQSRGLCGIDSLAGPSEIVVVADARAPAALLAADLISQVEHGEDSSAVLVTTSAALIGAVEKEIGKICLELGDRIKDIGARAEKITAVTVPGLDKAAAVVNRLAPEHLEIMVNRPARFSRKIVNAASIFIGPCSPVPAGDYMAGANHVLPTGGGARFASPLGVQDFVKRQSVTALSQKALESIADDTARFARMEGLFAHALSVLRRFNR